jgi:hypothetical protein
MRRITIVLLSGILTLGLASCVAPSPVIDDPPAVEPTSVEPTEEFEVTPELVVDTMEAMSPGTVQAMCDLVDLLGDYDLALASFAEGYGTSQDPPATEVFDEVLSRC